MKQTLTVLLILSTLFLVGCEKDVESSHPAEPAPVIDQANAKAFLKKLAVDYLALADDLETQSTYFEKNNDLEGFLIYRNRDWTPNYISRKLFYEKTLEQNQAYISQHKLSKPFEIFSSLIYIGLEIKHGFQSSDQKQLALAHKALQKNRAYMQKIKAL